MKIAIVGVGLCGRLLALELIKQGHEIHLFDKDDAFNQQSCGYVAAAMLSPYAETETGASLLPRFLRSIEIWQDLHKDLNQQFSLNLNGSIVVSHRQEQAELDYFAQTLQQRVGQKLPFQALSTTELHAKEPTLSNELQRAYYLPDEGFLDNWQFYTVVDAFLQRHRVKHYVNEEISNLAAGVVYSQGQKLQFDLVCDCRGLGAKADISGLRGVRGEVIYVAAPEVNLQHAIRFLHPRYRIYIVPRQRSYYVIGASEIESEDMSPLSVRSCLELLSAAYALHSGFAEARIIKTMVQCRPAMPDNLPYLHYEPGLLRINGLYRHGYLLAPALIEEALERIVSNE